MKYMCLQKKKKSEIRKKIKPTHEMQLLWPGPLPNYPESKRMCAL